LAGVLNPIWLSGAVCQCR